MSVNKHYLERVSHVESLWQHLWSKTWFVWLCVPFAALMGLIGLVQVAYWVCLIVVAVSD